MLFVPDHDPTYRIISIDPGTDTLGVALLEMNLVECSLVVSEAETFSGEKLSSRYPNVIDVHGDRVARLFAHEENLKRIFFDVIPHCVISEAPYMGRFPQAYGALVECLTAIRRAVMSFDPSMPLETVEPSVVKKAVGVSGKSSDKGAMNVAIRALPDLVFGEGVNPLYLDEHSTDAVAVGYFKYRQMLEEMRR